MLSESSEQERANLIFQKVVCGRFLAACRGLARLTKSFFNSKFNFRLLIQGTLSGDFDPNPQSQLETTERILPCVSIGPSCF